MKYEKFMATTTSTKGRSTAITSLRIRVNRSCAEPILDNVVGHPPIQGGLVDVNPPGRMRWMAAYPVTGKGRRPAEIFLQGSGTPASLIAKHTTHEFYILIQRLNGLFIKDMPVHSRGDWNPSSFSCYSHQPPSPFIILKSAHKTNAGALKLKGVFMIPELNNMQVNSVNACALPAP